MLITTSCTKNEVIVREGDLLFVVDSSNEFSKAITDATAWNDTVKFSHVAIVAMENNEPYILEASSERGVVRTEWKDFMEKQITENKKPNGVIMRLTIEFPIRLAIERAKAHLGKPYDWSFLPNNDKFYCSELVYDCYRSTNGSPLFTAKPMNFRDADGNTPAYWQELFCTLGEPIPQGIPGTNPNDMAKEPILKVVGKW